MKKHSMSTIKSHGATWENILVLVWYGNNNQNSASKNKREGKIKPLQ
jgi:hypothetical protein